MKINKIGDGKGARYVVRWKVWRDGKCVSRPQRTFPTRREAQEFIENLAAERRTDRSAARRTFADYARVFCELAETETKARTAESYRDALKYAAGGPDRVGYFGPTPVGEIRASDIRAFRAWLASDECPRLKADRSIEWVMQATRAVLDLAVEDDALPGNPAAPKVRRRKTKAPTATKFAPRFLSPAEVERIGLALDSRPPYGLVVRFLAYSGLRAGELAGLNVGDVRLWSTAKGWHGRVKVERTRRLRKGEWVTDTPKSARSTREVTLPAWLAEELVEYLAAHPRRTDPTAPLFPNRKRGGFHRVGGRSAPEANGAAHGEPDWSAPIEPASFYRNVFARAVAAAGLGSVRLHDLRHTYAAIMLTNGANIYWVSEQMGHASYRITLDVYAHLIPSESDAHPLDSVLSRPTATPAPATGGEVVAFPAR